MRGSGSLEEIRRDLEPLKDHEVVLYGSWCSGDWTPRSDIDVAVLSRSQDDQKNRKLWFSLLGKAPQRYDVRVFELLPLHVQINVVENYQVVFGDPVDVSEYFYPVRRRWKDVAHRIRGEKPFSTRERLRRLRAAKKP